MNKIKYIYNDGLSYVKNLLNKKRTTIALLIVMIFIVASYLGYKIIFSPSVTTYKLTNALDQGILYLEESKTLRGEFLESKISSNDFAKRSNEIQTEVTKINATIHELNLEDDIEIEKEVILTTGDALQGLVSVIFTSEDLKNLSDEILSLNIILNEIKTETAK